MGVDVHEIWLADTGEVVYRQIACEHVIAETAYEKCCEKYCPGMSPEEQDEYLAYCLLVDVDPATVEEVLI